MFITIGEREDLWDLAYVKLCRPLPELATLTSYGVSANTLQYHPSV